MKTLILMCGPPRCGKSTKAINRSISRGWPVVNPDAIRLMFHGKAFDPDYENRVWKFAHDMVQTLFLTGYDIVQLDATNTTEKARKEWLWENNKNYDLKIEWNLVLDIVRADKDVCLQRAKDNHQQYLLPVIERMYKQWQEPDPSKWKILGINHEL